MVESHEFLYLSATLAPALLAAIWDIGTRRIPNWLTASTFVFGLILHLIVGGPANAAKALVAALVAGGVFLIIHLAGGMGAGDVKLIAAVCCVAGLSSMLNILVMTALAGGLFAVALALLHGKFLETLRNVGSLAKHHRTAGMSPHPELNVKNTRTLRLPYAIPIALGCVLTFLGLGGLR